MKGVLLAAAGFERRLGSWRPPSQTPDSDPPLGCVTVTCLTLLPTPLHLRPRQLCSSSYSGQKPSVILDASFSHIPSNSLQTAPTPSHHIDCCRPGLSGPGARPLLWALRSINTAASEPPEMQVNHLTLLCRALQWLPRSPAFPRRGQSPCNGLWVLHEVALLTSGISFSTTPHRARSPPVTVASCWSLNTPHCPHLGACTLAVPSVRGPREQPNPGVAACLPFFKSWLKCHFLNKALTT